MSGVVLLQRLPCMFTGYSNSIDWISDESHYAGAACESIGMDSVGLMLVFSVLVVSLQLGLVMVLSDRD
jgi:hypothetical protein